MIFAKQVSIFGVHCLTKLIRLTADLAQTIWQINSEERHSFVRPGSDTLDEIDFPTADPGQIMADGIFLALAQSAFHQHSICRLDGGDKHPANSAGSRSVRDWTIADGEMRVLPPGALPLNPEKEIFRKKGAAFAAQDALMQRSEFCLNFRPHLPEG